MSYQKSNQSATKSCGKRGTHRQKIISLTQCKFYLIRPSPAPTILINIALPHEGKEDIFGYILRLMQSKFFCPLYPSTLSGTHDFPNMENVNQMPAHFSHRANNCCFHSNCRMDTNKEQDIGISIFFYTRCFLLPGQDRALSTYDLCTK